MTMGLQEVLARCKIHIVRHSHGTHARTHCAWQTHSLKSRTCFVPELEYDLHDAAEQLKDHLHDGAQRTCGEYHVEKQVGKLLDRLHHQEHKLVEPKLQLCQDLPIISLAVGWNHEPEQADPNLHDDVPHLHYHVASSFQPSSSHPSAQMRSPSSSLGCEP